MTGKFLISVMVTSTISLIMSVIVLNFHYRGPNSTRLPKWVRNMFHIDIKGLRQLLVGINSIILLL